MAMAIIYAIRFHASFSISLYIQNGVAVLLYFHIYVGLAHSLGFTILNFNFFFFFFFGGRGGQKNEYFWGMKRLWIFWGGGGGSLQKLSYFVGSFPYISGLFLYKGDVLNGNIFWDC